jgi:membrane-bound lytic murein transglycosylase D
LSPRSLAHSIQIVALALGSLCAGCQTVDYSQPRMEHSPRLLAGLAYKADGDLASSGRAAVADMPVYNGEDVWLRIAQRSRLVDRQGINERIVSQRDWLLGNRAFLRGASTSAGPYLHYIVERLDERKMPLELALLPMIESSYNPMASSPRAAAGLWQFVPATGRDFNLHQSATYDARRDVVASSKAAMDYLTRLHDQFDNDWLLALAAYNAGEGTVGRAIEANRQRGRPADYWHLTLPKETQDYVPRLLALSLIVRNAQAYGVHLTPVANTPYFDVVELNHAVDLTQLASAAGVEEGQLLRLNSAFLRKKTLEGPGRLLIPKTQSQVLTAHIARLTGQAPTVAIAPPHSESLATGHPAEQKTSKSAQMAGRAPVPKAVQPVKIAEGLPTPEEMPSIKTVEGTAVSEMGTPAQEMGEPFVSIIKQTPKATSDRSSPRVRYYNVVREERRGPRVVLYASEPRE